jgi:hypothetical protein
LKVTNNKKRKEAPPLYADIEVANSDDEGGNWKVAAVPLPTREEDDDKEEDAYEDAYDNDDEEEEAQLEG